MKNILLGALRSFIIMIAVTLFALFVLLPAGMSGIAIIRWIGTIFSVLAFLAIAFAEGAIRGEKEATYSDRMDSLRNKGDDHPPVSVDNNKCFSIKKGIGISAVMAVPVLIIAILAITLPAPEPYYEEYVEFDLEATVQPSLRIGETPAPTPTLEPGATPRPKPGDMVLREPQSWAVTLIRILHTPYLPLMNMINSMENFFFILLAFPYPVCVYLGYSTGPARRRKVREAIEKNTTNLKKKQAYMRRNRRNFR